MIVVVQETQGSENLVLGSECDLSTFPVHPQNTLHRGV